MMPNPGMSEVKTESSVDLLLKAQSGDEDALNRLLTRYSPRLQRWARGRLPTGLRTMLDTGDLVQEAVINALRHFNTFEIRSDGALQAYLRHAVSNRSTDLYRRAGRRPARGEMPEDQEMAAVDPPPLEAAIGTEALENYERALASLKDEDRQTKHWRCGSRARHCSRGPHTIPGSGEVRGAESEAAPALIAEWPLERRSPPMSDSHEA